MVLRRKLPRLRWRNIEGVATTIYDQATWVEDEWTTVVFLPYYPPWETNRLERRDKDKEIKTDPSIRKINNVLQEAFKYDDQVELKDLVFQVQLPSVSVKRALTELGKKIQNGVIVDS